MGFTQKSVGISKRQNRMVTILPFLYESVSIDTLSFCILHSGKLLTPAHLQSTSLINPGSYFVYFENICTSETISKQFSELSYFL